MFMWCLKLQNQVRKKLYQSSQRILTWLPDYNELHACIHEGMHISSAIIAISRPQIGIAAPLKHRNNRKRVGNANLHEGMHIRSAIIAISRSQIGIAAPFEHRNNRKRVGNANFSKPFHLHGTLSVHSRACDAHCCLHWLLYVYYTHRRAHTFGNNRYISASNRDSGSIETPK